MDCFEIKKVVLSYINHQVPDNIVNEIEEHFSICEQCRKYLGEILEHKDSPSQDTLQKNLPVEKVLPRDEKKPSFFVYVTLGIAFIVAVFVLFLFFKTQGLVR